MWCDAPLYQCSAQMPEIRRAVAGVSAAAALGHTATP